MTKRQQIIEFLRSHPEPFTLKILARATGVSEATCRGYMCDFLQTGLVGYAEAKEKVKKLVNGHAQNVWKERSYKSA